jgi:TM2 domain-containing membrane protein YozV
MSDETVNYATNNPATGAAETAERVGFCQDCGTPLTKETLRSVGSGVFCEPCLNVRVGAPAPGAMPYAATPFPGQPHPWVAALLGVIFPGAGACYNGQYAKGVAHLIIFAVLVSMANHVSSIFGLFVFGWVLYQAFDAYHTAKARLEGMPLPNPFGFNDIGERMGFGRTWGPVAGARPAQAGATTPAPGAPYAGPVSSGPDWVGYVPPTNFASAPPPVPPAGAQAGAAWGQAPYAQTYAPTYPIYDSGAYVPPMPVVPVVPARRFPVGALWLVGLGLVFLLAEFAPDWGWDWNLSSRWLLPILFAGLAVWTFTRRMTLGIWSVRAFRSSAILMTLALLFTLQAADVASLRRTWPVFLIVLGVLSIAERMALNTAGFAATTAAPASFVPPAMTEAEADAARTRAAWSDTKPAAGPTGSATAPDDHDITKGGI